MRDQASIEALCRLHHAAGATAITPLAGGLPTWRLGDDLERFIVRCERLPLRAGGVQLFSAHQMGTCRMGDNPKTSALNKWNQSHDVKNLFVVDGSSFVTGGSQNPTLTILSLSMRASEYLAEQMRAGNL